MQTEVETKSGDFVISGVGVHTWRSFNFICLHMSLSFHILIKY